MCLIAVLVGFFISNPDIRLTFSGEYVKSLALSAAIGSACGMLYYFGFFFYQKAVRISGAAMSSAFGKIGIIIPILLSAVIWKEYPALLAVAGIVLALMAILVNYFDFKSFNFNNLHPVLIIFSIVSGLGSLANKVFQKYCLTEHEFIFMFFIFVSALLLSLKATLREKKPDRHEVLTGLMLGIPNTLTSFFLIRALFSLPAYIVFPMSSAGGIVFALVFSLIFFKDKPTKKQAVTIAMIAAALVMINI
jgi:drug/metabolite transporter (DMT)-like permease